jgi:hypothetical protein
MLAPDWEPTRKALVLLYRCQRENMNKVRCVVGNQLGEKKGMGRSPALVYRVEMEKN